MRNIQPITHRGRLAAIVVAGEAIIEDTLTETDFRHVQAMCLYALEIADRERPGPYTDADAAVYAQEIMSRVLA
jgi:hypothetical protein